MGQVLLCKGLHQQRNLFLSVPVFYSSHATAHLSHLPDCRHDCAISAAIMP